MPLVSLSAFARLAGVSQPMIPKLIKAGKLTKLTTDDGVGIDTDAADSRLYLSQRQQAATPPSKPSPPPAEKPPEKPKKPRAPSKKSPKKPDTFGALDGIPLRKKPASKPLAENSDRDSEEEEDPEADGFFNTNPSTVPIEKLAPEVLREKIATSQLARRIKEGLYISRDEMTRFVQKYYRVHQGQLLPMGNTLAAKVSAALGVTDDHAILQVEKIINAVIYPAIAQIKSETIKWLRDCGAEGTIE